MDLIRWLKRIDNSFPLKGADFGSYQVGLKLGKCKNVNAYQVTEWFKLALDETRRK